jgi:hypothetical protein
LPLTEVSSYKAALKRITNAAFYYIDSQINFVSDIFGPSVTDVQAVNHCSKFIPVTTSFIDIYFGLDFIVPYCIQPVSVMVSISLLP